MKAIRIDTIIRLWDDDATWTTPGESSLAGTARGKDAVLAQYGRYGAETNGTFQAQLLDVFESEDGRVVGLQFGGKWTEGTGATENALMAAVLASGAGAQFIYFQF